ncbi:MAG: caspase family protein [Gemmatimonadota bacterium]
MIGTRHLARLLGAALLLVATGGAAAAQQITFASDLPRTLVFVTENGGGDLAAQEVSRFFVEAGFPLVDPALAHTAAQRELVEAALGGDEQAAVQLGRDFGAHMLVLGNADWEVVPNPADNRLRTGTASVDLRAIRLDAGGVLSSQRTEGRRADATEQAARTGAIAEAVRKLIRETSFVGALANSWEEADWSPTDYMRPDPGSVGAALGGGRSGEPRLAIIRTDVLPPMDGDVASRGIGIVKRSRGQEVTNDVVIEGIVDGDVSTVEVAGTRAEIGAVDADMRRELGLPESARRFRANLSLPSSTDSVHVVATGPGGQVATVTAAPHIGDRWAVVIGVGDYASPDIPDLRFAGADARAMHEFLLSEAAGPFEEDKVLLLTDRDATAQQIREAMFVFLQQADWDDLVVIYYAGHGAPDPNRPENLYLLPSDANMDALASTAVPMWDVQTALRRQIRAERVVVFADACHSGGAQWGMEEENPIGGSFAQLFTPSRRVVLTAASMNELSHEDTRWGGGHGVFTHHIMQGLAGAADADGNGIVTFSEVAAYVSAEVPGQTNGRQHPQRSGIGDVPLAVVPASKAASAGSGAGGGGQR